MLWFFSEESYSPSMVNGKKRVGSNSLCQGPITSSIDYQMAKPGPAGRRTNHRRSNQPLQIGKYSAISIDYHHTSRAWVSMGAAVAWHPPKFWVSPLVPADFVVLNTNWHPQSSFYVTSGTLSFKFLTQALSYIAMRILEWVQPFFWLIFEYWYFFGFYLIM